MAMEHPRDRYRCIGICASRMYCMGIDRYTGSGSSAREDTNKMGVEKLISDTWSVR